jgi:hypothetical protein
MSTLERQIIATPEDRAWPDLPPLTLPGAPSGSQFRGFAQGLPERPQPLRRVQRAPQSTPTARRSASSTPNCPLSSNGSLAVAAKIVACASLSASQCSWAMFAKRLSTASRKTCHCLRQGCPARHLFGLTTGRAEPLRRNSRRAMSRRERRLRVRCGLVRMTGARNAIDSKRSDTRKD